MRDVNFTRLGYTIPMCDDQYHERIDEDREILNFAKQSFYSEKADSLTASIINRKEEAAFSFLPCELFNRIDWAQKSVCLLRANLSSDNQFGIESCREEDSEVYITYIWLKSPVGGSLPGSQELALSIDLKGIKKIHIIHSIETEKQLIKKINTSLPPEQAAEYKELKKQFLLLPDSCVLKDPYFEHSSTFLNLSTEQKNIAVKYSKIRQISLSLIGKAELQFRECSLQLMGPFQKSRNPNSILASIKNTRGLSFRAL